MKIRATALEKKYIQASASSAGMKTADFMRAAALNKEVGYKLTPEEVECYLQLCSLKGDLVAIKNNFARLSNLIKNRQYLSEEIFQVNQLVKSTIDKVNAHLNKLQ